MGTHDGLVVDLVMDALVVDALVLDALVVDALALDALMVVKMALDTLELVEMVMKELLLYGLAQGKVVLKGMVMDLWLLVAVKREQPLLWVVVAGLLELNPKQLQLMQLLQPKCLRWRSCLPLSILLDSSSLPPF